MASVLVLAGCGGAAPAAGTKPAKATGNGVQTAQAASAGPIVVGVMTNDTGVYTPLGTAVRDAIQMVFAQANSRGGVNGHRIKAIYLDGQSQANEAVVQAKQLVGEHVSAVLGLEYSTATHAVAPIFERAHIPILVAAADETIETPVNPWVFGVTTPTRIQDQRALSYLKCKGITKVGVLHDTESLGEQGQADVKTLAPQYGVHVVADQKYDLTAKNMVDQWTALKNSPAQAVVYWGVGSAPAIVVKEHADLGIQAPIIASAANADPNFLQLVGKAANGMLVTVSPADVPEVLPSSNPQRTAIPKFAATFQKKYHISFGALASLGHDQAVILLHVLGEGATTPAAISSKLEHLRLDAFNGTWRFTPQQHLGLLLKDMVMARIVNGKPVVTKCQ